MKNIFKHNYRIIALLFACILMFTSVSYAADINITLTDTSKNGLKISDNNFFAAFNGIVPGETKRQDLIFTNTYGQKASFYIWSEAVSLNDQQRKLMEKLTLKLKQGDKELYTCNLTEVIQRKDLCTLKKNESAVISMYMTMPEEIDNTYAGQSIEARWFVGVDLMDDGSGGGGGGSGSSGGSGGNGGGSSEGGPGVKETPAEVVETLPAETTAPEKPTDPYGNEIESHSDNTGGDDTAGLEDQEPEGESGGSGDSGETGQVIIHGDIDPNIIDKDIIVVLEDENGHEHEIHLYPQNGFEASVLLPAGIYYVKKAYVAGDPDGALYTLVVSENRIVIGSTGVVSLTISLSKTGVLVNGELSETSQINSPAKQKNIAAIVLIIGGLLLIIGIIFIIFLKKKKDEEDEENE